METNNQREFGLCDCEHLREDHDLDTEACKICYECTVYDQSGKEAYILKEKILEVLSNGKKNIDELTESMKESEGEIISNSMSLADKVFYKEGYNQAVREVENKIKEL